MPMDIANFPPEEEEQMINNCKAKYNMQEEAHAGEHSWLQTRTETFIESSFAWLKIKVQIGRLVKAYKALQSRNTADQVLQRMALMIVFAIASLKLARCAVVCESAKR